MKVSVILPTYNERENIEKLVREVEAAAPWEIIVVDDDSPDGTWQVVEKLAGELGNLKLIRRVGRRGLASAIAEGVSVAVGDVLVWMDCDGSMPPEKIPALIRELERVDIAVGSRYVEGGGDRRPFSRALSSRLLNLFAAALLRAGVRDYTTGFVAAKRKVFSEVEIEGDYGEYCINLLFHAFRKGFKIAEVPYMCVPREKGKSKTALGLADLLKRGWSYGMAVLKLRLSSEK
ncbi:MAG: polyprenol monophosphomannose synthase [Methanobacteriota archaeon]|nr:MAG: polyprenol monophosphomannose synthase [Euryarchaeota archaeon]